MNDNRSPQNIDYMGMLRRRRLSFFIPTALGLCIAVAVALLLPTVYKSTSTILIEEQEIPPDLVMTTVTSYAEQRLEVIKQRIMSTSRLVDIANRFNLYAAKRDRLTTEELVEKMREDIALDYISAEVMDRRTGKATSVTIAFTLSYQGKETPETVRDVAQVLASLILEENIKVRERQVSETSSFFDDEMKRIKTDLENLDPKIAEFKKEHVNELPELLPVNMQSLNDVERKLELVSLERRSLAERRSTLQSQMTAVPMSLGPIETDKKRLDEMQSQLAILRAKFSDVYPDVIKLTNEIEEMKQRVVEVEQEEPQKPDNPLYITLANELAGLDQKDRGLEKQLAELEASSSRYKQRIAASSGVEGVYRALLAERESLEKKYLDLTARYMEAQVSQGLEKEQKGERFTIIDPAAVPERPFKPNRPAIMLLGAFFAATVGAGFALLREFADKSFHSPESLQMAINLPLLTEIPVIVTTDDRKSVRRRRLLLAASTVCLLIVAVSAIHFLYMDINVVFAKVMRRASI